MECIMHLEEASTHKSVNTYTALPFDFDLWPFDPQINGFPGVVMDHVCVTFDDPSCIVFLKISHGKTDVHKRR